MFDQDEQFIDYIADYLSKQTVQKDQFYQNVTASVENNTSVGADAELLLQSQQEALYGQSIPQMTATDSDESLEETTPITQNRSPDSMPIIE